MLSNEIGLIVFGVVAEDFLGIGTTEDLFYSLGRQPVRRDRFRRVVTEGVTLLAVDLRHTG